MIPAWTAAEWALMIGAVAGFITTAVGVLKTLAEVADIRAKVDRAESVRASTLTAAEQARDELRPNGGSTVKDAVNRIERHLEEGLSAVRDDIGLVREDVRGAKRDIGRLADADQADRDAASKAHDQIHRRIDQTRHDIDRLRTDYDAG